MMVVLHLPALYIINNNTMNIMIEIYNMNTTTTKLKNPFVIVEELFRHVTSRESPSIYGNQTNWSDVCVANIGASNIVLAGE